MGQKVIVCKGLPGSGKSTFSKEWVAKKPTERVRINKDDLRTMLHSGKYSKGNEKQVIRLEQEILIDSLTSGKSVVIDNTHLVLNDDGSNRHFERLKEIVHRWGRKNLDTEMASMPFELKEFNLSPEECIKRDLVRPNSVGQDVIWRMYWDHIAVIQTTSISSVINNPTAIVVDMDGTLAKMVSRSPFEWDKVDQDDCHYHVAQTVLLYKKFGVKVIIVTGRDGEAEEKSKQWLDKFDIPYDEFFIRKTKDNRKDYIVKREIYENYIKPNYNVVLVLDDRPQVIREWRRLGLPVMNANPIDREF